MTSYGVRITTPEIKRINASHASEATVVVVATVQNVGAGPVHATVVVAISGFSASQMHGTTAQVSVAANATERVSLVFKRTVALEAARRAVEREDGAEVG